jgi:thymidylate synthase (FAD)
MLDPWKQLRSEVCFGNVEPEVTLMAISHPRFTDDCRQDFRDLPECLSALAASVSYGSDIDSYEKAIKLNKNLIQRGHLTPLEAVQFNFKISGISKLCGAQMSRHRIGQGHVSGSRRFRKQGDKFVYPLLEYIETAEEAENIYRVMSAAVEDCMDRYNQITQEVIGVKKSDARYLIAASTATERNWWINCRALRNFFSLRLAPDSEWEIRRIGFLLLDIVLTVTPSLFEDIAEQFKGGATDANI